MAEWIYFIHPPRDDFAATMTEEEEVIWGVHFERFRRSLVEGVLILVGPTLGPKNTGIAIFEAPDEAAARRFMEDDPVIAGGYARGELRPFRVSLLRGRDDVGGERDGFERGLEDGPHALRDDEDDEHDGDDEAEDETAHG